MAGWFTKWVERKSERALEQYGQPLRGRIHRGSSEVTQVTQRAGSWQKELACEA